MKVFMIFIMIVSVSLFAFGSGVVTDDFNRADTTYSPDGSLIGTNWVSAFPADSTKQWRISSNEVLCDNTATIPAILLNTNLVLDAAYTYTVDIKSPGGWNGIVFQYQNPTNYYQFRIKVGSSPGYQIIKCKDGIISAPINKTDATLTANQYYTLIVKEDGNGLFECIVAEQGTTTPLNGYRHVLDTEFTNGYAGLICETVGVSPDSTYDNFNLWVRNVTDDFNRPDTEFSNDGSLIGSGWIAESADGNGTWKISGNVLLGDAGSTSTPNVLYNTNVFQSGVFTNSVDVQAISGWNGFIFNYQDIGHYYILRMRPNGTQLYQVVKREGTTESLVGGISSAITLTIGNYYTFTVQSDGAGNFDFFITNQGETTPLNSITTVSDSSYTNGYAGLYCNNPISGVDAVFDNFNVPDPNPPLTFIGPITFTPPSGTDGLTLTWNTVSGHDYAVQYRTNLVSGAGWSNLVTGIPGIGGSTTVTTLVDQAQAFFRITGE